MALSKVNAIATIREIIAGPRSVEGQRLDLIAKAMRPTEPGCVPPGLWVPSDAPNVMQHLASLSETNYIPLLVDTFSQVMKADGYYASASLASRESVTQAVERAQPWQHWQRNGMDARQTGIHRAGLQYGVSYVTVLPGTTGPVIRGVSPRAMTALYQDVDDDWPMLALHVDGAMYRLYDEEQIYFIGRENAPRSGASNEPLSNVWSADFRFIEARPHGAQWCPIVRYRDRMLLEGEEQYGIVEPLLTLQRGINETEFEKRVAQYYQAFKQRYVIGWVPESEQEMLKASSATVWTFEDDPADVKVGSFEASSPHDMIESKASTVREFAAIGQVAPQSLGLDAVSNISTEALAALQDGRDRKGGEIMTSFGESHEQMLRLCAWYAGDTDSANDYASELKWQNLTAQSLAQIADALVKLTTETIGLPSEMALEMIPNFSQGMVDRAKRLNAQQGAADRIAALASAAANARLNPTTAALAPSGNAG